MATGLGGWWLAVVGFGVSGVKVGRVLRRRGIKAYVGVFTAAFALCNFALGGKLFFVFEELCDSEH